MSDRRSSVTTALVLALILVGAWGIRYAYLTHMETRPGFSWVDPDGYTRQAQALIGENGQWRWSWAGVHYSWNNRTWVLPPGYPVFLSWFARNAAAFPGNAGHFHPVLGALLCALLFWIAARLHTPRAGLVAAVIGALWLPNVSNVYFFFQEQLYLPLLALAFALIVEAWVRESKGPLFGVAGAAFAVATLTRAMPLYFVPVAAVALVLGSANRAIGWRRAAWFVSAFAIGILPYVAWLSAAHGQLILIDNHGSIEMDRFASSRTSATPGVLDTVRLLATQFVAEPTQFASDKLDMVRGLFHVQGGRWLQYYGDSPSAWSAQVWKWTAHVGIDLAFVCVALLAPLGLVLARRPRESILLGLWVPVLVSLSAIAGYAGARYRAPIEPHLIVLASVVLAGAWRPSSRIWVALGLCGSLAIAAIVLPQVPRSLAAHAQYGIQPWDGMAPGATTIARGAAGVNVLPREGTVSLSVAWVDAKHVGTVPAIVWLNGKRAANVTIGVEPHVITLTSAAPGLSYVEIEPLVPTGATIPAYTITVSR